jgi:hypothetical protein
MEKSMNPKELARLLQKGHADKLDQWYCDLNCFRTPQGFPLELPEITDYREKMKEPTYRLAWDAVCLALGEVGMSRAWWLVELGKTEGEWRAWLAARGGVIAA